MNKKLLALSLLLCAGVYAADQDIVPGGVNCMTQKQARKFYGAIEELCKAEDDEDYKDARLAVPGEDSELPPVPQVLLDALRAKQDGFLLVEKPKK